MKDRRSAELPLVDALKILFADLADLLRKEIRLAKAEAKAAVSSGLQAGIWMAAAGVLGFFATLVLIQAIIIGLASLGLGAGWASLIVGLVLAGAAAALLFYGLSLARGAATSKRTLKQVNQDIAAVREQFT